MSVSVSLFQWMKFIYRIILDIDRGLWLGLANRAEDAGHTLRTFATVAPVGLTATDPRPDTL